MYKTSRRRVPSLAFPTRLLMLAFSFFGVVLAALLVVTCFVLALDKKSDPNAAISLPGGQKFAIYFTAVIFLIIIPIPLITFLSVIVHIRQRHSPSPKSSKLRGLITLQRLSLPPTQPFLFISSSKLFRTILLIVFLVQFADTVALAIVLCVMKNNEICLFNGRVVLCNILTSTQKAGVIVPAFLQVFCQFALFLLIKPYTLQVENESGILMDFDVVFGPVKGGAKGQGPFQRIPVFDPDMDPENGDMVEEGINRSNTTRYDPGSSPKPIAVRSVNGDRTHSFDYANPYDDPSSGTSPPSPGAGAGFGGEFNRQLSFKQFPKLPRKMTSLSMQGPRPPPKRSATLISIASTPPSATTTIVTSPSSITGSGKNKEWFKRFKSKTHVVDEDEDEDEESGDDNENEGLVPGSERKRTNSTPKKKLGGDADREDEGLL